MLRPLIWRTLKTNFGITALGLVNSILLSRWLGPTGRGQVAAAMLWPMLLVYIGNMGLISSIIYFSAQPDSRTEIIFANALTLAIIQSLLLVPIGVVALPYLLASQSSTVVDAARAYLFVIPFSLLTQYLTSILQGRLKISVFNWLRLFTPLGYLVGVVVLYATERLTLLSIVVLHLGLNLIILILVFVTVRGVGIKLGFRPNFDLAKQMLRYGGKVQVGDISQQANARLDQTLIAALLPPAELGIYTAAVGSASLSQLLSTAVRMVLTPSIAQKETLQERAVVLQAVFRKYWLLSLLATLAISMFLPFAIPIVFGADFKAATWPAELLLFGAFLVGAKDVLTGGAQALGSPWLGSRAELLSLGITITLLPILLRGFGIIGAAAAIALSYALQLVVVSYGLRRSYSISLAALFNIGSRDVKTLIADLSG